MRTRTKKKKNGHDERAGSAVMYTGEGLQLFSGMWSDYSKQVGGQVKNSSKKKSEKVLLVSGDF